MNKLNIHNNNDGISSFQNGLNELFSSTGFYFNSKVIEGFHKGGGRRFFKLWALFQNVRFYWGCDIFSCLVGIQLTLNYQNAYGRQTFQSRDLLPGAFTNKYAWHLNGVVLWGHVTNKIHISTCGRCMDTKLGKLLT